MVNEAHLLSLLVATRGLRLRGGWVDPLSLFACLFRQAHALRSFGQPIYIEVSGLRVVQPPHRLRPLWQRQPRKTSLLSVSAKRVRQRGDSSPTKFISNKTRAKQRRMSESACADSRTGKRGTSCLALGADQTMEAAQRQESNLLLNKLLL